MLSWLKSFRTVCFLLMLPPVPPLRRRPSCSSNGSTHFSRITSVFVVFVHQPLVKHERLKVRQFERCHFVNGTGEPLHQPKDDLTVCVMGVTQFGDLLRFPKHSSQHRSATARINLALLSEKPFAHSLSPSVRLKSGALFRLRFGFWLVPLINLNDGLDVFAVLTSQG